MGSPANGDRDRPPTGGPSGAEVDLLLPKQEFPEIVVESNFDLDPNFDSEAD